MRGAPAWTHGACARPSPRPGAWWANYPFFGCARPSGHCRRWCAGKAPFFGERAYTMTLAARLVQMSGARWLLAACERLPGGSGYVMTISEPPQPLPPAQADEAAHQTECATVINRAMEHLILQHPQ